MDHNTDSIRYMLNQLRSMQYPVESDMLPIVTLLLQKLGGEIEVTAEMIAEVYSGKYRVKTWHNLATDTWIYKVVMTPTTIDGEVVDDVATEGNGQRAIGTGEPGPRGNDRLG